MQKIYQYFLFFSLFLLVVGIVLADTLPLTLQSGAPFPVRFMGYNEIDNYTYFNATPSVLNKTRGYIYEFDIFTNQITHRWIGYVGNISGNISLMDNSRNSLYSWEYNITSGEVFATRFNGNSEVTDSGTALDNSSQRAGGTMGTEDYDYVDWTHVSCARREYLTNESARLGHNSTVDNDALEKTFINSTTFATKGMNFEVADRYINIGTGDGVIGGCSGTFLYTSNSPTTEYWQMVVLEDGTTDGVVGDLVYAAIIENHAVGFNDRQYQFQIMLPQYGSVLNNNQDNQVKDNIAYYFYLELIGEGWPSTTDDN